MKRLLLAVAILFAMAATTWSQDCLGPSCERPTYAAGRGIPVVSKIPDAIQKARGGIVMISNRGEGGGSGVYVGDGHVLTCDHLFRNQAGRIDVGRVVVSFPDGTASEATVIQQSREWDIALLRLLKPPADAYTVPLSSITPTKGDTVVGIGYGMEGTIAARTGRIVGFGLNKLHQPNVNDTMIISGSVRSGDSGGPIFNQRGELAGIIWGSGRNTFVGTQIGRVKLLMRSWLGRIACPPPVASIEPGSEPQVDACTTCREQINQLRAELAAVKSELAAMATGEPVAGLPGKDGADGRDGADAPEVDVAAIVEQVKAELKYPASFRLVPN